MDALIRVNEDTQKPLELVSLTVFYGVETGDGYWTGKQITEYVSAALRRHIDTAQVFICLDRLVSRKAVTKIPPREGSRAHTYKVTAPGQKLARDTEAAYLHVFRMRGVNVEAEFKSDARQETSKRRAGGSRLARPAR